MLDERLIADLIGRTYDAAAGNEDWAVLLDRLARTLGGHVGVLQRPSVPARPVQTVVIGADPANSAIYGAYYHALLPIRPWLPRLPPGSVFVDRELVPEADYIRTEFYTDFVGPQDQHVSLSWIGAAPPRFGCGPAIVSVWRGRRRPEFEDEQLRLLRHLGPHLDRALRLEQRLALRAGRPAEAARRADFGGLADAVRLTPRERDCLAWVARGASSKGVARQLGVSPNTVNEHVEAAMRKLGAASRTEAVALALTQGLLEA